MNRKIKVLQQNERSPLLANNNKHKRCCRLMQYFWHFVLVSIPVIESMMFLFRTDLIIETINIFKHRKNQFKTKWDGISRIIHFPKSIIDIIILYNCFEINHKHE